MPFFVIKSKFCCVRIGTESIGNGSFIDFSWLKSDFDLFKAQV